MEDQEIEKVSKLSCKFHGDFLLDESPVTFEDSSSLQEAARTARPWRRAGRSGEGVAAKLVRQISVRLIQEAQRALEDFSELKMRYNDLLKSRTVQQFQKIIKHIKRFMIFCYEFELGFQRSLATKLPAIRGGGEDEAELAEILKKRASCPFNSTSLNQWLECTEREVSTLESIVQLMPNTQVLPSQNHMYKETGRVRNALLFVFTALDSSDQFLTDLQKHLEGSASGRNSQDPEMDKWYLSKDLHKAIIQKARLFSHFAKANQGKDDIRFFAVGLTDRFKRSTIYCFEDGLLVSDDYVPPSEPEALTGQSLSQQCAAAVLHASTGSAQHHRIQSGGL
uniref:Uncharacterized protein n=1 Tax=Knipowitschia caucasica TaxID=637954 RepID=A0AAV2KCN6_KNICA